MNVSPGMYFYSILVGVPFVYFVCVETLLIEFQVKVVPDAHFLFCLMWILLLALCHPVVYRSLRDDSGGDLSKAIEYADTDSVSKGSDLFYAVVSISFLKPDSKSETVSFSSDCEFHRFPEVGETIALTLDEDGSDVVMATVLSVVEATNALNDDGAGHVITVSADGGELDAYSAISLGSLWNKV